MFGFIFGTACLAGLIFTLRRGRHWHHHGRGSGRWGWRGRLRWLFERLETSPGQAFDKLRDEVGPSRAAVGRALRGEQFEGAALRELFTRHDAAMDTLRRTLQGSLAQVHEALDPRQRRELADLIEHGFGSGWRHGGYGRCGGRGGWRERDGGYQTV
jgi:hypothetical protein